MIKRLLILALLAVGVFQLWGFDFGGSLGTYTKLGTSAISSSDEFEDFSLKQEEFLMGWFRHNFSSTSFFAGEVEARFRYAPPPRKKICSMLLTAITSLFST